MRVAIGLVAGQAALCGVIGWLTLGSGPGGAQAGDMSGPVAAPPAVMPTASIGQPAAPMPIPPPSSSAASSSRPSRHSSSPTPERSSTRAAEAQGRPPFAPPKAPTPPGNVIATRDGTSVPNPNPPDLVDGTPTPGQTETQGPVAVGVECDPEGADGLTADGDPLLCVRDEDGVARWETA